MSNITFPCGTYSGNAQYYDQGSGNWELHITTNYGGRINFTKDSLIDIFMVGGGGAGGAHGGGGGYTVTKKGFHVSPGLSGEAGVGLGGMVNSLDGGPTRFLNFTANGGKSGMGTTGGDGGSGGAFCMFSDTGFEGGSNGDDGHSITSNGTGQGFTTRAFGESSGSLYAGGGGAPGLKSNAGTTNIYNRGSGGLGGGGNSAYTSSGQYIDAIDGANGLGGGGGGSGQDGVMGGKGGSGALIIRNVRNYHTLSISKGEETVVKITRTSSKVASIGECRSGDLIYDGDVLNIWYYVYSPYETNTATINGSSMVSNDFYYTVNSDVNIRITSKLRVADIKASNGVYGSPIPITIFSIDGSYRYTLSYKCNGYNEVIASNLQYNYENEGSIYTWNPPLKIYSGLSSGGSRRCELSCTSYRNGAYVGVKSYTVSITQSYESVKPVVIFGVKDVNNTTHMLSTDSRVLILGKSTAECSVHAESKSGGVINNIKINGRSYTVSGSVINTTYTYPNCSTNVFNYEVTDNNGFITSGTYTAPKVDYVNLSCYASVRRLSPTSDRIVAQMNGSYFNGWFGPDHSASKHNELTLKFRYREDSPSSDYSDYFHVNSSSIYFSGNTFRTDESLDLNSLVGSGTKFDYNKAYRFQFVASDGGISELSVAYPSNNGSTEFLVNKGLPVFDWGEHDFNLNVPIFMYNESLLDFRYPVGSIYESENSESPSKIFGGRWRYLPPESTEKRVLIDSQVLASGFTDVVQIPDGGSQITDRIYELCDIGDAIRSSSFPKDSDLDYRFSYIYRHYISSNAELSMNTMLRGNYGSTPLMLLSQNQTYSSPYQWISPSIGEIQNSKLFKYSDLQNIGRGTFSYYVNYLKNTGGGNKVTFYINNLTVDIFRTEKSTSNKNRWRRLS